jgi:predicted nucleic-acid-binding Zn-ribbon protein
VKTCYLLLETFCAHFRVFGNLGKVEAKLRIAFLQYAEKLSLIRIRFIVKYWRISFLSEVKKCPKCGGEMEEGFLPGAPHWKPGRGIFGLRGYRIFGYRCKNCGFVEFYAKE